MIYMAQTNAIYSWTVLFLQHCPRCPDIILRGVLESTDRAIFGQVCPSNGN